MVYFVGAGAGAPDLITVRGMRLLEEADVMIYAGSLVNPALLDYVKKECRIYDSSRLTLEEVIGIMKKAEEDAKTTVRLHTGEPSIYGAVREQMDELDRLCIPYESCPGVSACFGAAASLNIEYTLPGISQSLIMTRMEGKTKVSEKESIESFAAHQASMAIYLSTGMLQELSERLIAGGYGKETPAALVYKATWPEEEAYLCTVESLYDTARAHGITKTAIVLVGEVIAHKKYERSRLYAADFSTAFRPAGYGGGMMQAMSLSMISFTENGILLSEKIAKISDMECRLFTKCQKACDKNYEVEFVTQSIEMWAKEQLEKRRALVFIGACGIAVRSVAPYISDKLYDSPVLVMDEKGEYVIPVLSGHMGGANMLAASIARLIGAKPVITTATDINKKFSVDLFAKKNRLTIANRDGIVKVSSKALAGETIVISVETGHLEEDAKVPQGIVLVSYPPLQAVDVVITSEDRGFETELLLRAKEYVIGIGCKKGKEEEKIEDFIMEHMKAAGLAQEDIYAMASIDIKRNEPGLIAFGKKWIIPFLTYTAEELRSVSGDVHSSEFVREKAGVDNVCERAALKGCGNHGRIVYEKHAEDGMTVAVAKREWRVTFDGE